VRTPLNGDDYFCKQVNASAEIVQRSYLEAIKPEITMHQTSAMLGDGTITQANTFDPDKVESFFQELANRLEDWTFEGNTIADTEDVHRIYTSFTKKIDKFFVSGYFGIQFHVLPYYKVDRRVIQIQKDLIEIEDNASSILNKMTGAANRVLTTELEKKGCANLEFENLFERMFHDENLVEELIVKTTHVKNQFPQLDDVNNKKNRLLLELHGLLTKTFTISPVLIDHNSLMQGEGGITNYFDIEIIHNKNKTKRRGSIIETTKMSKNAADILSADLRSVAETLQKNAR
jgi:hypothetical protein